MERLFSENRFEVVVHLAAQAGVRYLPAEPHAYIDANIVGFMNILEGCRHHSVKHLVFASSSSVYGANTKMPFRYITTSTTLSRFTLPPRRPMSSWPILTATCMDWPAPA